MECPSALGPLIDPNVHSCGTVRPHGAFELAQPEPGLFIAGMKSYGRAPTFLLATGYEQVRSIAAYLAGDIEGARRVELDLPQTGVCSAGSASSGADPWWYTDDGSGGLLLAETGFRGRRTMLRYFCGKDSRAG